MIKSDFSATRSWVFDLDNTLYPSEMRLFEQINARMASWVMDFLSVDRVTADHLRRIYYEQHGTTLAGLMSEHGMEPEQFLIDVHDIDFTVLAPDPLLRHRIEALPGRRIVYTNGTAPYAENVLRARGLDGAFDAIYGVEHAGFRPKPEAQAFQAVFGRDGIDTTCGAMFEDEPRNLSYPHTIGMRTIHVAPEPVFEAHISHHAPDLSGFLAQIVD